LLVTSCWSVFLRAAPPEKKEETSPYSLARLLRLVETNNLLVKISQLDRDIAAAEYSDARALPNPELELSFGKMEIPGEDEKPDLWGRGAKWGLPNPLYRFYFLKSARSHVRDATIEMDIRKREIAKGLKGHYYKLQLAEKIGSFLEEKLRLLEEVNTIINAKVSIGESKSIDALRSAVEIQKIKTELFRNRKSVAYERTSLNEYLNNTLPTAFVTEDDFSFRPLPAIEPRIKELIESSPFIRLKQNRLKGKVAHHKAARASIIEEIEVFAEREKEAEGKKWKVGVGISIPLFNWKSAHVRVARLQKKKARMELEHARKHFFADLQRLISQLRVLEKEIETFKGAALDEGRQSMELSEKLYKAGEIQLMVFLDSRNSYFEVQQRYYEAITEWNILKAELEALLGGGLN
jgi:outer membrane protein, heavy metal efflux system